MHGVCFRGGGREGEDGGLKCKTIAMRGLKVLLNIGGWWAKRLTSLIGSLINRSVATLATDAPAIPLTASTI